MKKIFSVFLFCSALVFSGCGKKDSLAKIIKNYPKEVVENFYKNGIVKTEKYDESVLAGFGLKKNGAVEEFFTSPVLEPDTQHHNECAGMSSAYVMRFYGENVSGKSVYEQISEKNPDGTVNPKPLKKLWDSKKNYKMYVCRGNIEDLKDAVSHNVPVIVLVECPGGFHYIPVTGFDRKYIYIQDSVESFRNASDKKYNRKETYKDFDKLWNVVLPESDHLMFIAVKY